MPLPLGERRGESSGLNRPPVLVLLCSVVFVDSSLWLSVDDDLCVSGACEELWVVLGAVGCTSSEDFLPPPVEGFELVSGCSLVDVVKGTCVLEDNDDVEEDVEVVMFCGGAGGLEVDGGKRPSNKLGGTDWDGGLNNGASRPPSPPSELDGCEYVLVEESGDVDDPSPLSKAVILG